MHDPFPPRTTVHRRTMSPFQGGYRGLRVGTDSNVRTRPMSVGGDAHIAPPAPTCSIALTSHGVGAAGYRPYAV